MKKAKIVIALALCMMFAIPFTAFGMYDEGLDADLWDDYSLSVDVIPEAEADGVANVRNYVLFVFVDGCLDDCSEPTELSMANGDYTVDEYGIITINSEVVINAIKNELEYQGIESGETDISMYVCADCDVYSTVSSDTTTITIDAAEFSDVDAEPNFFESIINAIRAFFENILAIFSRVFAA